MAVYRKKRMIRKKRIVKSKIRKSKSVSIAVKKYVKKALGNAIENKSVAVSGSNEFGSIAEQSDMNVYPMMPYTGYITIPQGVTQGTRTGNQVKVRRVTLNYALHPLQYNATTNPTPQPIEVLMYLGNIKRAKGDIPAPPDFSNLFQLGGTSTAPTGTIIDTCFEINKDFWDIKKAWSHKLGYANYDGTGTSGNFQRYANNDFKLSVVRRLDITKLCPANLKFDDSNTTVQGNNLFLFYQAVSANGNSLSATQQVAKINYFITITYEDA